MMTRFPVLQTTDPLTRATDELLEGADQDFVVVNEGRMKHRGGRSCSLHT